MFRMLIVTATLLAIQFHGARAAPPEDVIKVSVPVPYGDLDISREAGAGTLLARIAKASIPACGNNPLMRAGSEPNYFYLVQEYRHCRAKAIADAVDSVGSPLLSRLYANAVTPRSDLYAER